MFSEYGKQEDYEKFLKRFNGILNTASKGSKHVSYLVDEKIKEN